MIGKYKKWTLWNNIFKMSQTFGFAPWESRYLTISKSPNADATNKSGGFLVHIPCKSTYLYIRWKNQ